MSDFTSYANVVLPDGTDPGLFRQHIGAGPEPGVCMVYKGRFYFRDCDQATLNAYLSTFNQAAMKAAADKEATRYISTMDFVKRYTLAEQEAIVTAAKTDVQVQLLLLTLQTWTAPIDLDSPEVANGLAYLTSAGILTADRAAAIKAH